MFWTRNWGYVSSRDELAMLNRAEQHRKELKRECKVIQRRLLELLKQIKDESIDLVLADLPYGMTANKWDSV